MDWILVIVPLVRGGLAGAAVNAIVTSRRQRLDVTLSVIKEFFTFYEDIGTVKGIFTVSDLKATLDDAANLSLLRRIGDWYHFVASLSEARLVDDSLLRKVGVTKETGNFRDAINSAKSRCPEHLDNVWAWWPSLSNFNNR